MTEKAKNKSIMKTDKALRKAFCEFLSEDGYYVPTVQQLVDRAEISKPTFYRRYENIEDFIESEISFAVGSVCESVQCFEKALEEQMVSKKDRCQFRQKRFNRSAYTGFDSQSVFL